MLSIQDAGIQILGGNPGKFYALCGCEYGVKEKYIQALRSQYGQMIEGPSVDDLLNMMKTKHIIPLKPAVYVVRYDESFVSTLSDSTASKIKSTNVVGTIVCIYENEKHTNKLAKYIPDYTVSVDTVSSQFVSKYLHSDFPTISDRLINVAVSATSDYSRARNMCACMAMASEPSLSKLSDAELFKMFGFEDVSTELQIRQGIAARNFKYLIDACDKYQEGLDRLLYTVLQTMIELDKAMDNPKSNSDVRKYVKNWTREDIYYMFMHTYNELKQLRSISSYDVKNSLIYLFGLLQFPRIPSLEVMN